ncbi:MAG: ATP-binding protein [Thermoguttaceae bacterium]|nr:ATP-binding protein [Thermoguttaceae bacterium]
MAIFVTGQSEPISSVRRLLTEVIYNLCDNAIKYNVDGGKVDIQIADRTITVADTGIGIPASKFWVFALNALQNSMMFRPR